MSKLRLDHIHKTYPGGVRAVVDVDLEVREKELVVLVGPSGCGKSTLLRIVAGLETPTHGRVVIDERDVTDLPPQKRDVAMVFQTYALYPHKSVRENLAFGLRMRGVKPEIIGERIGSAARTLGIEKLLDRKPSQLSGGERQRVALGRAIVRDPKVFLLDEPLSNLDAKLRIQTRAELARLHRRLNVPMLYVTHDQEEAMTLGDRIVVLRDGHVLQTGTPSEVYSHPADAFVGGFIGSPPMNLLRGRILSGGDGHRFEGSGFALRLPERPAGALVEAPKPEVLLGIRPEDIELAGPEAADIEGTVELVEPLGKETLVHVRLGGEGPASSELRCLVRGEEAPGLGSSVALRLRWNRLHLFDAGTGAGLDPAET
jgi:ABC-type sugar transport system ATPase subunit